MAIDKALNPGKTSPTLNNNNRDFLKLQKAHSNNFAESRSVNPVGGVGLGARGRNNPSPPRGANSALKRGTTFGGPGSSGAGVTGGGPGGGPVGGSAQPGTFLSTTNMPSLSELNDADFPRFETRGALGTNSNNGGVKSGRADTFNPSVIQSSSHVAGVDSDQGLFVDRSKRELQIAEV